MPGPTTWLLVADSAQAKIFRAKLGERSLELVHAVASPDARKQSKEIASDRQGRRMDAPTPGRGGGAPFQKSSMDWPTDPQRHAQQSFASDVAEWLDAAAKAGRFDRLVIAAGPRALGDLRAAFSSHVGERVSREVDKDLTELDQRELEARLDELVLG
jgi:protein required for attachment to host cells